MKVTIMTERITNGYLLHVVKDGVISATSFHPQLDARYADTARQVLEAAQEGS